MNLKLDKINKYNKINIKDIVIILVQTACVHHSWWRMEAKLAIVFTPFQSGDPTPVLTLPVCLFVCLSGYKIQFIQLGGGLREPEAASGDRRERGFEASIILIALSPGYRQKNYNRTNRQTGQNWSRVPRLKIKLDYPIGFFLFCI